MKPGQRVVCVAHSWPRDLRRLAKKQGKMACLPAVGRTYEVEKVWPCECGKCSGAMVKLAGVDGLTLDEAPGRIGYPDAADFRLVNLAGTGTGPSVALVSHPKWQS